MSVSSRIRMQVVRSVAPEAEGSASTSTASTSATNSAYMAIRRVDQRPESATPVVCEPSLALVHAPYRHVCTVRGAGDGHQLH